MTAFEKELKGKKHSSVLKFLLHLSRSQPPHSSPGPTNIPVPSNDQAGKES